MSFCCNQILHSMRSIFMDRIFSALLSYVLCHFIFFSTNSFVRWLLWFFSIWRSVVSRRELVDLCKYMNTCEHWTIFVNNQEQVIRKSAPNIRVCRCACAGAFVYLYTISHHMLCTILSIEIIRSTRTWYELILLHTSWYTVCTM